MIMKIRKKMLHNKSAVYIFQRACIGRLSDEFLLFRQNHHAALRARRETKNHFSEGKIRSSEANIIFIDYN